MCYSLSAFRGLMTSSDMKYVLRATEIMPLVHVMYVFTFFMPDYKSNLPDFLDPSRTILFCRHYLTELSEVCRMETVGRRLKSCTDTIKDLHSANRNSTKLMVVATSSFIEQENRVVYWLNLLSL